MEKHRASRSAAIIAAHRAIESARDSKERICYDPLARQFLPAGFTVIGPHEIPEEQALEIFKGIVPGFHEFFLARTRYIDDFLHDALSKGLEQLVILGAGYDSRAYRFDGLENKVIVFEVDHPATQDVKKEKLKELFNDLPGHVKYVPVNFQEENLQSCLFQNGYDSGLRTLFIWEGVTMYIDSEAVDQTLLFISKNSGTGSSVIFDYTYPEVINGTYDRIEAKGWLKIAEKSDEPLLFGIENSHVKRFLSERGFRNIVIATNEYFNENYFTELNNEREATPILSIVKAEVVM